MNSSRMMARVKVYSGEFGVFANHNLPQASLSDRHFEIYKDYAPEINQRLQNWGEQVELIESLFNSAYAHTPYELIPYDGACQSLQ